MTHSDEVDRSFSLSPSRSLIPLLARLLLLTLTRLLARFIFLSLPPSSLEPLYHFLLVPPAASVLDWS